VLLLSLPCGVSLACNAMSRIAGFLQDDLSELIHWLDHNRFPCHLLPMDDEPAKASEGLQVPGSLIVSILPRSPLAESSFLF
jgi:hypothetical protein